MTYTQQIEIDADDPRIALAAPTINDEWVDGDRIFYGAIATVTVEGEDFDGGYTEPSGLDLDYDNMDVEIEKIVLSAGGVELEITEKLANHMGFLGNLIEMIKEVAIDNADWVKSEYVDD